MASRNGHTVFDLLTEGWKRTVVGVNGDGDPGVGIPAEYAREHDIELGDTVAVRKQDGGEPVLELHFEPNNESNEE